MYTYSEEGMERVRKGTAVVAQSVCVYFHSNIHAHIRRYMYVCMHDRKIT